MFVMLLGLGAVSLGAVSSQADAADSSVEVATLEVENRTEPLGIDVASPKFSWVVQTQVRDVEQTGYRLQLATADEGLGGTVLWDSGTVASDDSRGVKYAGPELDPATAYVWSVDVSTTAGQASGTSTFSTGLFDEADWAGSEWIGRERAQDGVTFAGAQWIWTPEPDAPYAPAEPRAFRKSLASPDGKSASRAEIIITADDSYKLWVNGDLLGQTAGAENEWQGSKLFTADLDANDNVIAVRTTNGANTPAGLLVAVRITYGDGSTETFTSDASWKASKTVSAGFEAKAFDDSSWQAAAVQASYGSGPWGSGVSLPAVVSPAPLLRKEFGVTDAIASAKIYVAAGGYADVSLNGAPINDEMLSPGFTDYDDHVQYVVTDVTKQLTTGTNALGVELGRGFYGMTNGNVWNWQNAPWHDEPVVRAVLRITYADGQTSDVVTDSSWTLHDGPTLLDDLYGGETYDARLTLDGFDTAGYGDATWVPASEVSGPEGELINQQQQPIRVTERLPAESISEPTPGVYVVKFPRVLAGNVEITAQGVAGTTIRAQYGEKLKDNGRPNFSNNGGFQNGFQTDRFTLAGTGQAETWAAKFSYKGFQYIEVTGWPGDDAPSLSAFTALALHTDAEITGSFNSSDRIMNETHDAVVNTLLNNIHGIPTDTPMFEKNGWTGDAAVGMEMFMLNLDVQNLFEKWMGDINDTRDADGAPLVIAPSSGDWGEWGVAPPWHSAYILIPWWLYQYGGDSDALVQYYDGMKTYVDLEYSRSPGGVVPDSRLGDWVSPEASPAGGNAPEDVRVSATAYLYEMLISMEKTATFLGKSGDAAGFADQAAVVKQGFNDEFLDADAGYYRGEGDRGYRQTHNALALAFDLAPDAEMADRVAASLAADVVAKGNKLNTGSLGSKYLLPVLTDYGYSDLAYKVAVQTDYPSWGYMIENGATTMWEHWSLEARSRGHYFLGTVDDWFFHYVAGIRASELTGYRDITIAPAVTDNLDWANAETATPYGPVSVDWKKTGDVLNVTTHVPVGSTATVHLPAPTAWAVTESGTALADAVGVHDVAQDGNDVVVTIGSGDYSFDVDPRTGEVGVVLDSLDALQASVDNALTDSGLSASDHGVLSTLVAQAHDNAVAALPHAVADEPAEVASELAGVLMTVDEVEAYLQASDAPENAVSEIMAAADTTRVVAEATLSAELGITSSVVQDAPGYKPGTTGTLAVTVDNGGVAGVTVVTATASALTEDWHVLPDDAATVTDTLGPDASGSAEIGFTVPMGHVPSDVDAGVEVRFDYAGATVRIPVAAQVTVDSPVVMTEAEVTPAEVAPGGQAMLTATVQNSGSAAAVGHLDVDVPDGWTPPLATSDVVVPANSDAEVTVPINVPLGADRASAEATLTARFVRDGVTFASKDASLTVALADAPAATGYDHIDLGDSASEQAHQLTASASSGTNSEAGYTRRYAGHLTDFSYFEFEASVVAGQPFVIRAIETYDKVQTKKYKIYVDGTEVHERLFAHTAGGGIETYEFVVDGALATESPVVIKFENLDNHTYYDPSIADVWTLPLAADTTAPQVVAHADPSAPHAQTGWYTTSPVTVELSGQDDSGGTVGLEFAAEGADLAEYGAPVVFSDEGEHTLAYQGTDPAGNTSQLQELVVKIDTVAPSTTATLGDGFDSGVAQVHGIVDLVADDATSGVAQTRYRVNNGDWTEGTSVDVTTAGDFTVDYFSLDVAGNTEAAKSISGTIVIPDSTPPTVMASISHPGKNGWYLSDAALTLEAHDDDSGVSSIEYQLGDDDWVAYDSEVALPEGNLDVSFRATDAAGNVSETATIQAKVDGTAPAVWAWLSDEGRVVAVGTDAGSDVDRLEYSIAGDSWASGLTHLIGDHAPPEALHVRAVDLAGNTSPASIVEREENAPQFVAVPGADALIEASGFAPGVTVRIELHSEPVVLATTNANSLGVIAAFATIPTQIEPGAHTLVLAVDDTGDQGAGDGTGDGTGGGAGSGDTDSGPVTGETDNGSIEIPVALSSTGSNTWGAVLGAAIVLLSGIALVGWARYEARTRA